MPNVDLLQRTLTHIRQHPETWDQGMWVNECGTAFCFAGHAVNLSGLPIDVEKEGVEIAAMPRLMGSYFTGYGRDYAPIRDVASYVLEINDDMVRDLDVIHEGSEAREDGDTVTYFVDAATALFYAGNSFEDLECYVSDLCDQAAAVVAS